MQSLSSNITSGLTYTFAVGLGTYAVILRVGPLRLLTRIIINIRAAGFMSVIMAKAAYARRCQWAECVRRAQSEL